MRQLVEQLSSLENRTGMKHGRRQFVRAGPKKCVEELEGRAARPSDLCAVANRTSAFYICLPDQNLKSCVACVRIRRHACLALVETIGRGASQAGEPHSESPELPATPWSPAPARSAAEVKGRQSVTLPAGKQLQLAGCAPGRGRERARW